MNEFFSNSENSDPASFQAEGSFDFTYVTTTARIAFYDDLRSAPRITEIPPAETSAYIENLTSRIYEQSKLAGGSIPYTVIREVSENFIHARFQEIVVSILDKGNTIRFADQGPGISNRDKAQLPGFSSAIEPMKHYIRGVGSGLPIVKEYLDFSNGTITIEDNLVTGAVVTISLNGKSCVAQAGETPSKHHHHALVPPLSSRERDFLLLFLSEADILGVSEISKLTGVAASSTHVTLKKLEEAGLIQTVGKKRMLTAFGAEVAALL